MRSNILIRPIISEKSMAAAAAGHFTFEVAVTANKDMIAAEVAKTFKVTPVSIQTITIPGKIKKNHRNGKQIVEQKWKKAVITLPKGQKIDLFDVTETPVSGHPERANEIGESKDRPKEKKDIKSDVSKEVKKINVKGAKRDA
jgi:large subunit ribosomal protein L23